MRLFRQRELGEWEPVIEEVRDALRVWCDADKRGRISTRHTRTDKAPVKDILRKAPCTP
jgi:hypothetical protein